MMFFQSWDDFVILLCSTRVRLVKGTVTSFHIMYLPHSLPTGHVSLLFKPVNCQLPVHVFWNYVVFDIC